MRFDQRVFSTAQESASASDSGHAVLIPSIADAGLQKAIEPGAPRQLAGEVSLEREVRRGVQGEVLSDQQRFYPG